MILPLPRARLALALLAGLVALLWAGKLAEGHLAGEASDLDRIEAPLLDLRFAVAGPRRAPRDVLIVAIDDNTAREAGSFPLPRATMARLVEALAKAGPSALGLDILFLDPKSPEEDSTLASALREAGAAVAAGALFARDRGEPEGLPPRAEKVLWPLDALRRAAAVGLVNIAPDDAGTPRHVPLIVRSPDGLLPSFVLLVAARGSGREPRIDGNLIALGEMPVRLDLGYSLPLRFYGPRGSIETVSAAAILRGAVDPARVKGRIVVVGATAIGAGDTFPTPYDPVLPGIEVLATAIGHLTAGDGLVRDVGVRRVDGAAAVLLALGTVVVLSLVPLSIGVWAVGFLVAAWLAATFLAFDHGVWLSATVPIAAMAPPFVLCVAGRLVLDRRGALRLATAERALRRFQPPVLASRIAADPAYLAEPRAQPAAVLFIDLSRFTRLSERLGPAATRDLLRDFHGHVEAEVTRHGGVVLSFMGDGAMIVFGLPDKQTDDAARALQAALALADDIRAWTERVGADLSADLDVRVGAHFGPVVVSRLGADDYEHITATGDTVNVASRLLEVAGENGAVLAVSAELLDAASTDLAAGAHPDLRKVRIRGRREPLTVALWRGRRAPQGEAA